MKSDSSKKQTQLMLLSNKTANLKDNNQKSANHDQEIFNSAFN